MIKCTLVQALRLCTGRTAHRGNRGIALLFIDHGTRREWGVSSTPRPLFNPGKDPVTIVQEAGWAPGPVWPGAENLTSTGIRSLDRPTCSQSLYWLSYPAHILFAASQEIPCISRNPKVHYRTHKRPPPISILGQPNPVHIPTSHLLEIHPNIIHPSTPRPPQWYIPCLKYSVPVFF